MNIVRLAPLAATLAMALVATGCNHSMRDTDTTTTQSTTTQSSTAGIDSTAA